MVYTDQELRDGRRSFYSPGLTLGICVSYSLNPRPRVSGVPIPRRCTVSTGETERDAAITLWVPPASGIVRVSYPDPHRELRLLLYTDIQT